MQFTLSIFQNTYLQLCILASYMVNQPLTGIGNHMHLRITVLVTVK